jgi:hypothetical protein
MGIVITAPDIPPNRRWGVLVRAIISTLCINARAALMILLWGDLCTSSNVHAGRGVFTCISSSTELPAGYNVLQVWFAVHMPRLRRLRACYSLSAGYCRSPAFEGWAR